MVGVFAPNLLIIQKQTRIIASRCCLCYSRAARRVLSAVLSTVRGVRGFFSGERSKEACNVSGLRILVWDFGHVSFFVIEFRVLDI